MLGRYIDLGNPVANHPLNLGLTSWWLPLPNNQGGRTLFDLKGRASGALSSGATWGGGFQSGAAVGCTGGASVGLPLPAVAGGDDFVLVVTHFPLTWTGGFTTLFDDPGRVWSTFFNASGAGTFEGSMVRAFPAFTMTAGRWWQATFSRVGGTLKGYQNGVEIGSTGAANAASAVTLSFGSNPSGGGSAFDGRYAEVRLHAGRGWSGSEAALYYEQWVKGHPNTLCRWTRRVRLFGTSGAGGGGGTTVTPTTAALTLAAFAPTVLMPVLATPATAALTLSAFAPTVSTPILATPTTASLTLATFAPTVGTTAHQTATPTTASLVLATFAPTVSTTAHQTATPTTAGLSLATFAPAVSITAHQTATPSAAALTLTAFAPSVTTGGNQEFVPDAAALTLAAFAPTIATPATVTPTPAALSLTAFAPTVSAVADVVVTPPARALTLAAFAPAVTAGGGTIPDEGDVRFGVAVGSGAGTLVLPDEADVRLGTMYGAGGTEFTGTLWCGEVARAPGSGDYIEEFIAGLLLADVALATLVDDRVYPDQAPEDSSYPRVIYQEADRQTVMTFDGPVLTNRYMMDLEIAALDKADTRRVGRALRRLLIGYRGSSDRIRVLGIFDEAESDSHEIPQHGDERGVFTLTLTITLWYRDSE